ncbi:MAG TPA: c-type cytochrome [Gammaproteobacteria bacterium]|nr:c-type cytochrome [Gammaproteobacteria bacterium]
MIKAFIGWIILFGPMTLMAAPLGLPEVTVPADNPQSAAKIELGKQLFFDKRLSADGTVSCASCHQPERAFTDGRPTAVGIRGQVGPRNAPTVLNAAFYTSLFHDGRADSLETQALGPLTNPIEHGLKNTQPILALLRNDPDYRRLFQSAFGEAPEKAQPEHIGKAIASYERTLVCGNTPFDRFLYGGDETALSESAQRGLRIFRRKGNCANCHEIGLNHSLFTDNRFYNLGVGFERLKGKFTQFVSAYKQATAGNQTDPAAVYNERERSELGRFLVTGEVADIGKFRTPTLRNISLTGPYMHDGSQKTLEDVVEYYNQGGEKNPFLDPAIYPLHLTEQEKADLVEFLNSLSNPACLFRPGRFPNPGEI